MNQALAPTGGLARAALILAWLGLGLALACGAAELVAGLGYRLGWWHFRFGTQLMRWSATTDLAAVLFALTGALLAWKSAARRSLVIALAGLVLSLVIAGPPLYLYREVGRLPRIHDITTDTANPPRFVAVLPLRKGAENSTDHGAELAAQQKKSYPDIAPLLLNLPPAQAMQRAEAAARALGWDLVAVEPAEMRIEATDTTLLFGFKDDIVVRVTPEGAGSRVDVRSTSRVGRSDFGANAKRIRRFMRQLEAAQAGA